MSSCTLGPAHSDFKISVNVIRSKEIWNQDAQPIPQIHMHLVGLCPHSAMAFYAAWENDTISPFLLLQFTVLPTYYLIARFTVFHDSVKIMSKAKLSGFPCFRWRPNMHSHIQKSMRGVRKTTHCNWVLCISNTGMTSSLVILTGLGSTNWRDTVKS